MVDQLTYRDLGRVYLTQAYEELEKQDLRQASEKGWGAAAQIVKAVAESRHMEHRAHLQLRRVVNLLVQENNDEDLQLQFGSAGELHTNFYECWMSQEEVATHLRQVSRFLEKIEALLD